ncbi:TetR/AcrR family transcriptional regulator [Agromyces sp. ISL-38]|uniref:TetR/AcrR family transcriptional regulator n=1 Tax=Agromyces sp. ISL-38 TaxID=2819107 RepID=UPI001BEB71B0|nr:TetR/AcrR family transcriptional regulator [Agromyces sp. ISL-38]MBT2498581.1 TetR/AcrR family transcriptional regulator [Agromyces sp. ISL-38]
MTATREASRGVGKPRGSYAKTEQKRIEILDAALEVFAQSGYRSGSIRDIAAKIGMSEAGLLHHFPNKSALLAAVLDRRDDQASERFPIDLRRLGGRAAVSGLLELAAYNASTPNVVALYCILSAEGTSPTHPAHAYFINRYQAARGIFEDVFTTLQNDGDLRNDVSPASAARSTIAMMDGLQIQWLLDRTSVNMTEELRQFFRGIVNYDI